MRELQRESLEKRVVCPGSREGVLALISSKLSAREVGVLFEEGD